MAYREVEPYRDAVGFEHNHEWHDDIQYRCSTWREAEEQHEGVVARLRQAGDQVRQLEPEPLAEADRERSA